MKINKILTYNPYFFVPFLLWVVLGGLLHWIYGKVGLFVFINGHHTSLMDNVMYFATWVGTPQFIVPMLLLPMLFRSNRTWWYFSLATACNVAPLLVLHLLKSFFDKPRPLHFYENAKWINIMPHWERLFDQSFPSGHTEGAFSVFCFLSLLLPGRYRFLGALFFMVAMTVGYSLVYLTAHFFEDIYAGSIVGVVMTLAAYEAMQCYVKRYFTKIV